MATQTDSAPSATSTSAPTNTSAIDAGIIYFDGEMVPQEEAKVSVLTHALHYGTSVFEGVRAYETSRGAAVFRLQDHSQRLLDSAKILGMPVTLSVEDINEAILATVRKNERKSCYIRPLLWYGAESLGVSPARNRVHFMVATMPWGVYLGHEAVRQGAKLMTSSWRRSSGDIMPTKAKAGGNYVNSVLANSEARDNGFDEALLLDKEGFVAEGSGENIFFLKGGTLYPIAHSVNLRGITRDTIVKIAEGQGTEVKATMATRDELYIADEVFMVGTAAEVTPIASIDRRPIGNGVAGPYALRMRETYLNVVTGEVPEFEHWLSYVG
ncbi:branched-chain amino acid transaminase [soil metagenome]